MKLRNLISDNLKIHDGLYINGLVYFQNQLIEAYQIQGFIDLIKEGDSELIFNKLNGTYSIIFFQEYCVTVITSPDQFYPVFYLSSDETLTIADHFSKIEVKEYLNDAAEELKTFGFILDNRTISNRVKQCRGGYITHLKPKSVNEKRFFNYGVNKKDILKMAYNDIYTLGFKILDETFERAIVGLRGRTAVIPLSGGYDSRLIASYFVKKGVLNIVAYTFGKPQNPESKLAGKVAEQLKIKWYNIEYTNEFLSKYKNIDLLNSYIDFAFNGRSSVHLQDFYAVLYLKNEGLIPEDSIFIPGHSGDALGGSQLVKVINPKIKRNEISANFINKKSTLDKLSKESEKRILNLLNGKIKYSYPKNFMAYSIFEDLDVQEKLSKFTLNAAKVYQFFGYECLFPFWDIQLLDYWRKVDVKNKINKCLFDNIIEESIFSSMNILFERELQPPLWKVYLQLLKERIKPFLPLVLKRHLIRKNDFINYLALTLPLVEFLNQYDPNFRYEKYSLNSIVPRYITQKKRLDYLSK